MQNQFSENKSNKKMIIRRAWFWILVLGVCMIALFFIMLPFAIEYGIASYLKDQGADKVSLEDVDFNPITGWAGLTNLTVKIGTQTVLKIPEAALKIQYSPLIRKRIVLAHCFIKNTELTVQALEESRWQIGGIKLPDQKETAAPASWNFGLQQLTVKNSRIKFISSQLSSDLKIEQAAISKLRSWQPERSAHLEFAGQLNDGHLKLQMELTPFGSDLAANGRIKLNGLTLKPFAQLLKPQLNTLEGRFDADLKIDTHLAADGGFNHQQKGHLKLSQIRSQIGNTDFSSENLAWDGALRVDIPKSQEALKISSDGQLNSSNPTIAVDNANLRIQQDDFDWNGKIDYAQDKTNQHLNTDGRMHLAAAKMRSSEIDLTEEKLTWKGILQFSATTEAEGQKIMADGALNGSHLLVNLLNHRLGFEHHGWALKGQLDSGGIKDFKSLKAEADVICNDFEMRHTETNQRLVDSDQINLRAVKIEGLNHIDVSSVAFNGLALLAAPEAAQSHAADHVPFHIQQVKFKDVQLSQQNHLAIEAIQLDAAKIFVHRDPAGKLASVDSWNAVRGGASSADQAQQSASGTSAKEKSEAFGFRIGQIDITGDSGLRFRDESVSPAFDIDLNILEARLSNLDNRRSQQPASIKLLVSDTENARLSLGGTLQPFGGKLNLDWVGKIEAVELPHLSPYVIRSTGYRFTSGELEADVPLKIDRNELKGEIDLMLLNPRIKKVKAEISGEEQRGKIRLNMTLDSALRLLRDKQNDVKLKIPISGNINDPQFSVADAINQVLAKTLQKSALSYLKYMLGPYGIGISVAQFAYEQAIKIRLNPILFAPGSDELDEAAIDYLKRVAAIMQEYPAVQVAVCGVATESDRKAMDENASADAALLALAKNRTDSIENQLVKLNGIEAKRIIACEPDIDKTPEAKPRADLEI